VVRTFSRRSLLRGSPARRSLAAAEAGGSTRSWVLDMARAEGEPIRPPGALPEPDFLATCTTCGDCVEACPFGTLKLATGANEVPIGTPYFTPRDVPCEMCEDVPCARVCPTAALDPTVEIRNAQMGLAVLLDQQDCLAFKGLRCEACTRACPAMGEAMTLDRTPPARPGEHACFLPVVHSDACTGCGQCERACVLEVQAIRVLPRAFALGVVAHSTSGWEEGARITKDFVAAPVAPAVLGWADDKAVLDSMNDLSGIEEGP